MEGEVKAEAAITHQKRERDRIEIQTSKSTPSLIINYFQISTNFCDLVIKRKKGAAPPHRVKFLSFAFYYLRKKSKKSS